MLRNYLLVAIRTLKRNKVFSSINILGLAVGMTCCFLILLYVHHEQRYDRFHSNAERVYRLKYVGANDMNLARVPPIMTEHIPDFFPEVEAIARMYPRSISVEVGQEGGQKRFEEDRVYFVDSSLTRILDIDILSGDPLSLEKSGTIMLNERVAEKYFGTENPVGKHLRLNDTRSYVVGAVFADFPSYSHIRFHALLPYEEQFLVDGITGETARDNLSRNWVISHSYTYMLLHQNADPAAFDARVQAFMDEQMPDWAKWGQTFELQAMTDIQLHSGITLEAEPVGDARQVKVFSIVAMLILAIACMNFVNLSTAQALKRCREVGMRKVMGAGRRQLIFQFLGESALVGLIAFLIAMLLLTYGIPVLNEMMDREILLTEEVFIDLLPLFGAIFIGAILLAGLYPAIYMTSFRIIPILKGNTEKAVGANFPIRKVLVVSQFALSVLLISGSVIIYHQVSYMLNRPLGFEREHIINVPMYSQNPNNMFNRMDSSQVDHYRAFETEVLRLPEVTDVTVSGMVPGTGTAFRGLLWEGKHGEDREYRPVGQVDYDFLDFYGVEMVAGRSFLRKNQEDLDHAVIINRFAVQDFGWNTPEEALGKKIDLEGQDCRVVGVFEDFNFMSLHTALNSLVLQVAPTRFTTFSIKYRGEDPATTAESVAAVWNEFFPGKVFDPMYLDDVLANSYSNEARFRQMISYFALLAIFISCLGAYGLILYSAQRRTREIGIRKVLGAPVLRIMVILFKEFTLLFALGFVLATPAIWYFSEQWLEDFNYRISLGPQHFLLGGFLTLIIIWATISYQSIKAAFMNPVKALRTE